MEEGLWCKGRATYCRARIDGRYVNDLLAHTYGPMHNQVMALVEESMPASVCERDTC